MQFQKNVITLTVSVCTSYIKAPRIVYQSQRRGARAAATSQARPKL